MKSVRVQSQFLTLFVIIIHLHVRNVTSFPNENIQIPGDYNFIIVGGGTAGCVLANRLSANGKHSVLLLEAGGVPPEIMNIPGLARINLRKPDLTFQYESIPQRHGALGTNGGRVYIPLGRVLGGTSQINTNMFNRGNPKDYNNWANLTGDPSWRYENMLKYFKRAETYLGQFPSDQHGFSGAIPVSHQEFAPGRDQWFDAGRELGYQVKDASGPQEISFTPTEFSRRFGRRVSSYTGYLKPIMNSKRNLKPIMNSRTNLKVITNAYVTRLISVGNTVTGVQYNSDGSFSSTSPTARFVYANREVIVSSGTYGSATLLMRSGIGPRNVLRQAKINLVKDLPVGENFQDHPEVPLHFILNNKSLTLNPQTDYTPANFKLFQEQGRGPYTSVVGFGDSGEAYISSSVAAREGHQDWPDFQLVPVYSTSIHSTYRNFTLAPWETSMAMILYLGREKSRRTVKLNPKNIEGMPIIDFNYLGDDGTDVEILLDAINLTLKIFERTKTYHQLGARFPHDNPVPACSHLQFRSKEYWTCLIRQTMVPGNHPVGTCSMNSVVDSSLRVIGMKRLRVVDASVMPYIVNTNTQAAVFGIAEKAADTILVQSGGGIIL